MISMANDFNRYAVTMTSSRVNSFAFVPRPDPAIVQSKDLTFQKSPGIDPNDCCGCCGVTIQQSPLKQSTYTFGLPHIPSSICNMIRTSLPNIHYGLQRYPFLFLLWMLLTLLCMSTPVLSQNTAPEFDRQPEAGSAEIKGNTKVLLCYAQGTPLPVYQWLFNGVPMFETDQTESALKIQDIQRDDAGVYQCRASNDLGAILSNRVNVTVAFIVPFQGSGVQEHHVLAGKALIIDLPPIESYPEPAIRWYHGSNPDVLIDSQALAYQITLQHQLVILSTDLSSDGSTFKAKATNGYTGVSTQSQVFRLNVVSDGNPDYDNPNDPGIIIPPMNTTAIQGEDKPVVLECVANSPSLNSMQLKWYRKTEDERIPIEQTNKYVLSRYSRRLTIKQPAASDTGVYECEATFGDGSVDIKSANVSVFVKPSFLTQPPSTKDHDYGESIEIACQVSGTPFPKITWYKNAEEINFNIDARYSMLSIGNLKIDSITTEDAGVYQCFATNGAGEISASTWLKVQSSPPSIYNPPVNKTAIAGDSVSIPCGVSGAPKPDVSWYRVTAGAASEDMTADSGRYSILSSELLIPVVMVTDTGKYTCEARNNMGFDDASAYLTVTVRTRIVSPPQDASVIKGAKHILQCGVDSDPSVFVRWTWFHEEIEIPNPELNQQRRFYRDGGSSLEIYHVQSQDIGTYRCEVTSTAGNDEKEAIIQVIELPWPPAILSVALNENNNRSVVVSWNAGFDGNSPIRNYIVQYRIVPTGSELSSNEGWSVAANNVGVEPSPGGSSISYPVTGLKPATRYQFRVSAVNDVGEGEASQASHVITMPQQPPSGPPRGVVGSPSTENSMLIQWQDPDADKLNGILLGFMIRYKPSGYPDTNFYFENVTNYATRVYSLNNLIVFTEYEVSVAAYNAKGIGVYSDVIRVRTMEGIPTQAPRSVSADPVSSTSIRLQWLPPSSQHINGINQGYKINATRNGTLVPEIQITVPTNISNMLGLQMTLISQLRKYTSYSVTILCYTSRGDGPASNPVSVQTFDDVPDQVNSIKFTDILDSSLTVQWTPPNNINGILVGYTLTYMKKDLLITKQEVDLAPDVLEYTITGLSATTTYTIEVYARTRAGAGPVTAADVTSEVPPERPAAPKNLAISNLQATSVLLQFIQGFSGYTSITKWIIEAQVDNSEDWMIIFEKTDPEATSLTVENLRPYTNYKLRMIAENVAGQSEPSEPTRSFQTIQAAPSSPPSEVTVRAVNETAIRVRWKPLSAELWNGETRGYILRYRVLNQTSFINTIRVMDENANSYSFGGLEEYTAYEVQVAAVNSVGESEFSSLASDRTRESVPSAGPSWLNATAVSSTSIMVHWGSVFKQHQNGEIKGYKIIYTAYGSNNEEVVDVDRPDIHQETLRDLLKFTRYTIQVLAYTRIGDGTRSHADNVKTDEDVPGPPSSIHFPVVTPASATVEWSSPREPNGVIVGYRVTHRKKDLDPTYTIQEDNLGPNRKSLEVTGLVRETYYVFTVTARTQLGWGEPGEVEVYTKYDRRPPEPPSKPQVGQSQVGARWVTLNWQPGNDGYGPIRNYTIEYQEAGMDDFLKLPDFVMPNLTAYTVENLKPNTVYRFQVSATNDKGTSLPSIPSDNITTKPTAPDQPPSSLEVIPKTTTSVLVQWKSLPLAAWNGDIMGYMISYAKFQQIRSSSNYQEATVFHPTSSIELVDLEAGVMYEVKVNAYNEHGNGPTSAPVDVYVGEAVPTEPPVNFRAMTQSSTEIGVEWEAPDQQSWNGDLLGYKVYYWMDGQTNSFALSRTVAATETSLTLTDLNMFTEYNLVILAFNAAGDGPNTTIPIQSRTLEGIPSMPGSLKFVMISLTTMNVSWAEPTQANGYIDNYEVSYQEQRKNSYESRRVQVIISGTQHYHLAKDLSFGVMYVFRVRAETQVGWGEARVGNITTGPQPGSPESPTRLELSVSDSSIYLDWLNGDPGSSPIKGYIIQSREKNDDGWVTIYNSSSPHSNAFISLYNLKPNTEYQFRVIAINDQGISYPSRESDFLKTLEIENKPFYRQWWFLVIVAMAGVILIIIVISLLCITNRRKTVAKPTTTMVPKTIRLEETLPSSVDEDAGFSTYELRQSGRSTRSKSSRNNTLPPYTRLSNFRSPPRPSPGSVQYSDEKNAYAEDSSSLSEKPSDLSSLDSDSQRASDSDLDDEKLPPPPFSTSYANSDIAQSWQRGRHMPSTSAYAYTDSEQDSSHYAPSLNGGHMMLNNMAGSRAPLPGFSSFV